MGTELSKRGLDLEDPLWSARVLIEAPEAILDVHRDYLSAGAELISTASYQVSEEGFQRRGLSRAEARRALRTAYELAQTALRRHAEETGEYERRAAVSLGPYGAMLADGSEYTGAYSIRHAALVGFHRARFEVVSDLGAALVAVETLPTETEAEAVLEALEAFPALAAWISFVPRVSAAAVAELRSPQLVAIGFNCGTPELALQSAADCAQRGPKPVIVYPNRGGSWDAAAKQWRGAEAAVEEAWAERAAAAGVRAIGGCCGVGPAEVARLRARRDQLFQAAKDST